MRVPEELEVGEHGTRVQRFGPAIIDQDPLRFHYHGLAQLDNAAACIYFYRVLEYYAFFSSQREISRLRHDFNLADVEFTKKILDLITRDEKGPILRLVGELADDGLLTLAHNQNLINVKDKSALGIRLYEFRNSIVHGKQSYGYILSSTPVIAPNDPTSKWREVLRRLAEKTIQSFGQKLI